MRSMVAKGVLRPSWQLERGSRHGAVRHTSWCVNGKAMALRCFVFWKLIEGRLGVQVVEGVGLVACGFQFFTRLAAVFAEEFDGFFFITFNGIIKRCSANIIRYVDSSTFGD